MGFIQLSIIATYLLSLSVAYRGMVAWALGASDDLVQVGVVGAKAAGMEEWNKNEVLGLMLQGLMWWLGWCLGTVGDGSHPCRASGVPKW